MTRGLKVNGLHNKYALYNLSGVIGDCIKHENALKNLICLNYSILRFALHNEKGIKLLFSSSTVHKIH